MNEFKDEELLKIYLKDRNEGAFKVIFDRHSRTLFSFIYRFTVNQQAADEIVQDIFAELLSGKFTESFDGSLKSWLFTVARNKSLNLLKKKTFEMFTGEDFNERKDDQDLEYRIIHSDLLGRLSRSESILPPEILQTWSLRKQGLDNNQIANQLSIPVGTVKSRFFRLVEIIREEFLK